MKQRLLVMNGSRIVQAEDGGAWQNKHVDKAGALKPGIYNIFNASAADTKAKYEGVIVHTDKESVYQQTEKKEFVMHKADNFDIVPKVGESKSITYNQSGKAQVQAATEKLTRSKTM